MKKILLLFSLASATLVGQPAKAAITYPTPVRCYFFRGERVEIQETCILSSGSGTSSGEITLQWPDGVITKMRWRNDRLSIDGYDAFMYWRDSRNFQRLPTNIDRTENLLKCWQSESSGNSVCWRRLEDYD